MRRTLVLTIGALGLILAACGSSSPSAQTTSTTTASRTTTTPVSTSTTSAPSTSTSGASGQSSLPAVGNATDLSVEPTIAAGTPPPPSTLQTKDLVVGTGATATSTSTVKVQYAGANYATGKIFDASWTDSGPTSFSLNGGVIPGFAAGIVGMKVGGRREIVIPPAEGYGASGNGPVGPNETLVFVVDLLGVS